MGLRLFWIAAFAGIMLLSPEAHAQPSPQWQTCTGFPDVDWDQQLRSCSTLIESGQETREKRAVAYLRRGVVYGSKGDHDRAIADFSEAIRLDPQNAAAYRNRGLGYDNKGDRERAIADFDQAIRIDPKLADAYSGRCWVRAVVGRDLAGALADCNESLRLRPDEADVLNSRGLVQLKLGAFDRAVADYGAAIAKNAKDADSPHGRIVAADSLYGRGVAKLRSGDRAGGEADMAAAKAIKGDMATVYAGYGVK
jgi:tetratricopeptide (TPR) repeat protein